MIVVTVMYPNTEGSRFDQDYYLATHMPLVQEKWGGMGLQDSKVLKGVGGGAPGQPAKYQVVTQMTFDSMENFAAAGKAHGAEIFADIKNFTDVQPVMQVNTPLG